MKGATMSSEKTDWETPQAFFAHLNQTYDFTLDAAASAANAQCAFYYTESDNALELPWLGRVWCNPPYGRYEAPKWVKKAFEEAQEPYCQYVVMLLPARTDTAWWHDYVMKSSAIMLVRGRLRFVGAKDVAPYPSAVVVFGRLNRPDLLSLDARQFRG